MKLSMFRNLLVLGWLYSGAQQTLIAQSRLSQISGSWKVHVEIHGTKNDLLCNFLESNAGLAGVCNSGDAETKLTGTVSGNSVQWSYLSKRWGKTLTTSYSGVISADGMMSGAVVVNPFGVRGSFSGIRQTSP